MKFNFDPAYLDVKAKAEFSKTSFLGRHYLTLLTADGWARALRKEHQTTRRAMEWGVRCVDRLRQRYESQHKEPTA